MDSLTKITIWGEAGVLIVAEIVTFYECTYVRMYIRKNVLS